MRVRYSLVGQKRDTHQMEQVFYRPQFQVNAVWAFDITDMSTWDQLERRVLACGRTDTGKVLKM